MSESFVLYFGCKDEDKGHFLWLADGMTAREQLDCPRLMVPKPSQLDGTFLFLPRPERPGDGALTYLPATDRTILAWWDRTFDDRPNSNAAIIATGRETREGCWRRFAAAFPRVAAKLSIPTVVRG